MKFWDSFKTFSKNLTIKTIIITLIILFLSWSKLFIFNVESANLPLAKSISLINNSYTPKPKINKTIPIKNKSIDEIILNNKLLLLLISWLNKGLFNIVAWIISHPPIKNNDIEEIIDNTTSIYSLG